MPLCNNVKPLLGLPEIKKKNVPDFFYSKCHLNFQKTTFSNVDPAVTLCVLVSPKCVLWQNNEDPDEMGHFTKVHTV